MLIWVKTFNGENINDGTNYRAWLLNPHAGSTAKPVFLEQADADPVDAGVFTVDAQTKVLRLQVLDYANRLALISQLKGWFKRGTEGLLVVTFTDESVDYQRTCRVVNLVQDPEFPEYFTALLGSAETAWRSVSTQTDTWGPTGSGGNKTITVGGDDETRLIIALTPTLAPASGFIYQNLLRFPNVPGVNFGYRAWCIIVDTAALIADNANKCQINQVGGINNSVTTIPYDTVTGAVPSAGMGMINGVEQISWTGRTGTTSGNLTGVTRGIGGTGAASHADNVEIKVSYMLANCQDVRFYNGETEIKRWIADPNTSTTNFWVNLEMQAGWLLDLKTAINNSETVTFLQFKTNDTMRNRIRRMPTEGILYHGTEWFYYRGTDHVNARVTIVERGVWGTAKQAHALDDDFVYIQNPLRMVYGNPSASNPASEDETYDDEKPVFNLSTSDNTQWVYDATTKFHDLVKRGRTGQWSLVQRKRGNVSRLYHIKGDAESDDPAMGIKAGNYQANSMWLDDTVELAFVLPCPGGFSETTMTGRKYRSASRWMPKAALQRSVDGQTWIDVWNEATPTAAGAFENWATHSAVSIPNTTKFLRLVVVGIFSKLPNGAYAMTEALTGTIKFYSTNLPTATLLSRTSSYPLDLVLTNNANSDAVTLKYPMIYNKALLVNGETNAITFDAVNAHRALTLNDEGREIWIRLLPGSNQLNIAGTDIGTLSNALSWYRRRL